MGGNYWLNMVILDELIEDLHKYMKPVKFERFESESSLRVFVLNHKDAFFVTNRKYVKFQTFIQLEFIVDYVKEGGRHYFKIDSVNLKKLV